MNRFFNGTSIYSTFLSLASLAMVTALILLAMGNGSHAGPFLVLFFLLLGLGFRGFPSLKSFSFTIMILGIVTTALYYPEPIKVVNGFQTSVLIIPLLQIIMFGMGATMSLKTFIGVFRQPKGVILGFLLQFTIMPFVGLTLAKLSGFPPEIAAGIILVGCSPGGLASNVMAYLAKGNVPLSLTLTSVNTLLAPVMTPLLMTFLAGTFIEIDTVDMMIDILKIVIFPVAAGIVFNEFFSSRVQWMESVLPKISIVGIAVIVLVTSAYGREGLLDLGFLLVLLVLTHNLTGYTLGYLFARMAGMNITDSRTLAIEVGMQNASLGKGIALAMGKLSTLGLAPLVFGPLMNVTGSMLATYWGDKAPEDALDLMSFMEAKNRFIGSMLENGIYSKEQLSGRWSPEITAHFLQWVSQNPEEHGYSEDQLAELLQIEAEYAIRKPRKLK